MREHTCQTVESGETFPVMCSLVLFRVLNFILQDFGLTLCFERLEKPVDIVIALSQKQALTVSQ